MNNDSMVYLAESITYCVHPAAPLADIDQAQVYLDDLLAKPWFSQRWPKVAKKRIQIRAGKTWKWSASTPWDNKITLSPFHLNNLVILHELAHFCAEREIHKDIYHGPEFCGAYLYLMKRMAGAEVERSFRHALKACGVEFTRVL